jgi:hypothetical protein
LCVHEDPCVRVSTFLISWPKTDMIFVVFYFTMPLYFCRDIGTTGRYSGPITTWYHVGCYSSRNGTAADSVRGYYDLAPDIQVGERKVI